MNSTKLRISRYTLTIWIDNITGKVRFPAVSTPEYNLTGLPIYANFQRRDKIRRKVEPLTNISRIDTTLTREIQHARIFLTMITDNQQVIAHE